MIEGVFDDSIFDDAAFETGDVEAFVAEQETLEDSFAEDHGPLVPLPYELFQRRRLWVKRLADWKKQRAEALHHRHLEELALLALS